MTTDDRPLRPLRSSWGRAATAWFWSLQFALLNPVLAVLLTTTFGGSGSQAGIVLALYNAAGFVASLVVPAIADRRGTYAAGMVASAACGIAFVGVLLATRSLVVAAVSMVVLGAPTGVGATLLFAHLRHSGATPDAVVRIRAVVSVAWVAGPPLSTLVTSVAPGSTVLVVVGAVGVVNLATSLAAVRAQARTRARARARARGPSDPGVGVPRSAPPVRQLLRSGRTWGLLTVFVVLQLLNGAAVTSMGLFVTRDLHAPLVWSGTALGLSALAEVPALLLLGRLLRTRSPRGLVAGGAAVGTAYYLGVALLHTPLALVLLQPLNSWFFATVAGVGLTVFQDAFDAPGLAAGVFANTRQVAAVLSGGLIALVAAAPGGYGGVYWVGAAGTAAVAATLWARGRRRRDPVG